MAQVIALITRVIGLLGELLGITQSILGFTQKTAEEHSPYLVESIVTTTSINVAHPTYGLAAIRTLLDTMDGKLDTLLAGVNAISLPDPAPSGYGGLGTDNLDLIWRVQDINTQRPYGDLIADGMASAYNMGQMVALPLKQFPGFAVQADFWDWFGWYEQPDGHGPDWSDIRVDDTLLTWLTRTWPALTWQEWDSGEGVYAENMGHQGSTQIVHPMMSQAQFLALRDALHGTGGGAAANVPPVWPGLESVTLGAPVSLANVNSIAGPLDGVVVAITTPPQKLSQAVIGGENYWWRVGELAFATDDGDLEPWQYLGFQNALYCPRQMKQAGAVHWRVLGGADGTVTPFTIAT